MSQERVDVIVNSPLDSDFLTDSKKLTPIIFSHGLTANKSMHTHICKELASYGCIVYALDHTDSSCSYILDIRSKMNDLLSKASDGQAHESPFTHPYHKKYSKDLYYVKHDEKIHKQTAEEYRMHSLDQRMKDIEVLYEYIKNNEEHVDIQKLTVAGHSMGGITALDAAYRFPFIKYCISLDPFFCPRWQLIQSSNQYCINQPFVIINTERFHTGHPLITYDSLSAMAKFASDSLKKQSQENKIGDNNVLFLKNTDHYSQVDVALNDGISLKLIGEIPFSSNTYKSLKENNLIMVAFLNKHKLLPVLCDLTVEAVHNK